MKKMFAAIALSIALSIMPASGQVTGLTWKSAGPNQVLPALGTATGLTVPSGATTIIFSVEGQAVRYRDDGTAPTASVGVPLPIGMYSYSGNLRAIQFFQQAPSATITVVYYK